MNIVMKSLEEIKPYENNPRINDGAVDIVAQSIREFGFKVPIIVDKHGVIVAGHTRYRAAKKLGLTEVPTIIADDLTEEQVKAFRIMDNKSAEFADWDYLKLLEEIKELEAVDFDIELTGFSEFELANLVEEEVEKQRQKEEEERPEIEFTHELLEEHQYIVLYFDNTLDWNVAKEVFGLKTVKALGDKENFERKGLGRVINGAPILEKLQMASSYSSEEEF